VSHDCPQRKGHRFRNPWPNVEKHGLRDLLRWTIERRSHGAVTRGQLNRVNQREESEFTVPRGSPSSFTATWVGHTTVLLQLGGLNILTDPIWSDRASPFSFAGPRRLSPPGVEFDDLPPIDAVVISHDHYDHLDSDTVRRLAARFPAATWMVPLGVARFVRSRGATSVEELTWHESRELGRVRVSCVPAQHFSGRTPFDRDETLWCGWVLASEERSVFFAGDTALNPSFTDIGRTYGPFDLALMPIGAYDPRWLMRSVHMDPEECVRAALMIAEGSGRLPTLLATHWGAFKLTDEPIDEPPDRMARAWSAAGLPRERLWILSLGQTRSI
jgi:N-acyl-phosphatidylethanolamine-hydrolysing phospholipase D